MNCTNVEKPFFLPKKNVDNLFLGKKFGSIASLCKSLCERRNEKLEDHYL